jgi:hypothetical protein
MFYNRILRVWVIDQLDYFLLSLLAGSLAASHLKKYLSEKVAMERLKNSIIEKSEVRLKLPILSSKKSKIKQLKLALRNRGGELEEFSNEIFDLAQTIKGVVERLAAFLKKKELKGIAKIFFKNGRLVLELILYKCNINITYAILSQGLSVQVIVITSSIGGVAGFVLAWFSVGAILVSPSIIISALLMRSVSKQILDQRDYLQFKNMVNKMLDDDELKETVRAFFVEGQGPTPSLDPGPLKMEPLGFDEKSALKYNFNLKSDEDFEEFVKVRIKEELGLIENPTEEQLQQIIQRKVNKKFKAKTVFFGDFIDENLYESADFSYSDVIEAGILEEPIRIKLDNDL